MGGVPSFTDFSAAYDPKRGIYYVIGYFQGTPQQIQLNNHKNTNYNKNNNNVIIHDNARKRECFEGECAYLYIVDINTGKYEPTEY